jgi:hypothetical protein
MIRGRRGAVAGIVIAAVLLSGAAAYAGTDGGGATPTGTPVRLYARMTGAAERPTPTNSPGVGDAIVYVYPNNVVCTTLRVARLTTPVVGAHIHVGAATTFGPVVIPLTPPTNGFSYTCATVSADLATQLRTNPTNYYANVHTTMFPGGEIRGQLAAL